MKHIIWVMTVITICIYSCTSKHSGTSNDPVVHNPAPVENKTDTFFPVSAFLKSQLIDLDTLPVTPLYITTVNGRTDSAWVTKLQIKPVLSAFETVNITENNLSPFFKETKFNDQTLHEVTFSYDPKQVLPDSIGIRQWVVYVNPDDGKVDNIYLVKRVRMSNQTYLYQLTWKTNHFAQINTILQDPAGAKDQLIKQEKIIWNFN